MFFTWLCVWVRVGESVKCSMFIYILDSHSYLENWNLIEIHLSEKKNMYHLLMLICSYTCCVCAKKFSLVTLVCALCWDVIHPNTHDKHRLSKSCKWKRREQQACTQPASKCQSGNLHESGNKKRQNRKEKKRKERTTESDGGDGTECECMCIETFYTSANERSTRIGIPFWEGRTTTAAAAVSTVVVVVVMMADKREKNQSHNDTNVIKM